MTRRYELEVLLRKRLGSGGKILIPYLTAGLPSPQRFVDLAASIAQVADAIEIGIPFSDPIMDGPVIQEASARALAQGMSTGASVDLVRETVRHTQAPALVMTYFNPIHRMGIPRFATTVSDAGALGVVVPDLPLEESGELKSRLDRPGVALIQMVAPTTPDTRVKSLASESRGFVYAVSRLGVTGVQDSLADAAGPLVERIKAHTDAPVLVGIGVSNADQAREVCEFADGVIVGSALMKRVLAEDLQGAATFVRELRAAISP